MGWLVSNLEPAKRITRPVFRETTLRCRDHTGSEESSTTLALC